MLKTINDNKKRVDNRAAQKNKGSFFNPLIQAKLAINQPNDIYEQEANAVASKVMQANEPAVQTNDAYIPVVQKKNSDIDNTIAGNELDTYVAGLGNSGKSLPAETNSFFSGRLGYNFSNVKIHTDDVAAKSAASINARAYTTGNNIVFNTGEYEPQTQDGKRLLAHELTHVVQQTQNNNIVQKDDPDADKAAAEEAKKKAALVTKIKTYGIISVEDADATFTSAELDLVDKALAGLPATDKAAIKGAKIIRISSLGATTAGQYSNTQSLNDTTITDEQKIELSNRAFGATTSAAESIRLVTHEVGHAVATMPLRVATTAELTAGAKANKLINESNTASDEFNTANDASNAAIDDYNAAIEAYNAAIKGTDADAIKAAKADVAAKKKIMDPLKAARDAKEQVYNTKKSAADAQKKVLETKKTASAAKLGNIDDLKTDAAAKLTAMQTAYAAADAVIKKEDAESADYRTSLTAVEDAIKKFYDENVTVDVEVPAADAAKTVVDSAITDRNKKRDALNKTNASNTITTSTSALETAQDNCFKAATVVAFNKSMNLSVKRFYDFVIQKGISPALTTYAAENWPHKPEEFYAEAYSFFVTKPKDLEAYSKDLFDWFNTGKYK